MNGLAINPTTYLGFGLQIAPVGLAAIPAVNPLAPFSLSSSNIGDPASKILAALDAAQEAADAGLSGGSFGSNLKYYASGWTGGSRGNITAVQLATPLKVAGALVFAGSVGFDAYQVSQDKLSLTQFGVNTAFASAGFFGPPGAVISVTYGTVEAFYPGGWMGNGSNPGFLNDIGTVSTPDGPQMNVLFGPP